MLHWWFLFIYFVYMRKNSFEPGALVHSTYSFLPACLVRNLISFLLFYTVLLTNLQQQLHISSGNLAQVQLLQTLSAFISIHASWLTEEKSWYPCAAQGQTVQSIISTDVIVIREAGYGDYRLTCPVSWVKLGSESSSRGWGVRAGNWTSDEILISACSRACRRYVPSLWWSKGSDMGRLCARRSDATEKDGEVRARGRGFRAKCNSTAWCVCFQFMFLSQLEGRNR